MILEAFVIIDSARIVCYSSRDIDIDINTYVHFSDI